MIIRAEIGTLLLVAVDLIQFVLFAAYTAQTDRELYELRHRVTMLEMQKDGEQAWKDTAEIKA